MQLTIGADPELFLTNGNNFISAHGLVRGTKSEPLKVKMGSVQVDGTALEIGIDPVDDENKFVSSINTVLQQLREMIPSNYIFSRSSCAVFDPEYMKTIPEYAKNLGCDPDFDAYEEIDNPRPKPDGCMRTAAGHVHIGWTNIEDVYDLRHFSSCCTLTRQLDYILGIPSLLLDEDDLRREVYGKAGSFRPKTYGLEYRVLSNFWLHNELFMRWVYRQSCLAVSLLKEGHNYYAEYNDLARSIINNSDRVAARRFVTDENIQLPI